MEILRVEDLQVVYHVGEREVRAVDGVSFSLEAGERFAVVGESGSGKSTLASAIMRIVRSPGEIKGGKVIFEGTDLLNLSEEQMRRYRWKELAMVFQAAQNSLNPVLRIEEHFLETAQDHGWSDRGQVLERARKLLKMVRLDPERVLRSYPHELSGGMKQRVIIALSLIMSPKLLILDEPTTALDVITQDYIFNILMEIIDELKLTVMLLTHDISIVAKFADRVGIMYAGDMVEIGNVEEIFYDPLHPYTRGLINATPSLVGDLSQKKPIPGEPPDLLNPPPGCKFHPRCELAREICKREKPTLRRIGDQVVMCHLRGDDGAPES